MRKVVIAIGVVVCGAGIFMAMRNTLAGPKEVRVPWADAKVDRDISAIKADTLRVLVLEDPLTWEQRPNAVSGLEYDLLKRFSKDAYLPVSFIAMDHPDSMIAALQRGEGDLIASQLTPRNKEGHYITYTASYRTVRPVLAVLRADPAVPSEHVNGTLPDTLEVSRWSPFAAEEYKIPKAALGKSITHVVSDRTPEELLMDVVLGKHNATIITDARAAHESGRFPVLEFRPLDSPPMKLCFALRKNSVELKKALNKWLIDVDNAEQRKYFMEAYSNKINKPGPLRITRSIPFQGDSISPFDRDFKRHANESGWDWELLAAMAYKESRFDTTAISNKGALGLMQIMPATAMQLGLDSSMLVGDHIAAATRFLTKLDRTWLRAVPNAQQRLRFVLASYNAGPGHIIDAQRLAERLGLDPQKWEHNVERAVLLLSKPSFYMDPKLRNGYCNGNQVFYYVRDICSMYQRLKERPKEIPVVFEIGDAIEVEYLDTIHLEEPEAMQHDPEATKNVMAQTPETSTE